MFEDIKGVIRNCKSEKVRQYNSQKKKYKENSQWSTQHYTEH
jgi:hypothetical protein